MGSSSLLQKGAPNNQLLRQAQVQPFHHCDWLAAWKLGGMLTSPLQPILRWCHRIARYKTGSIDGDICSALYAATLSGSVTWRI
jgi:hypothetical protein